MSTAARVTCLVWVICFVNMHADIPAASPAAARGRCYSALFAAAQGTSLTCPISCLSFPFGGRGPPGMVPIRSCQQVQELLPLRLSCRDNEGRSDRGALHLTCSSSHAWMHKKCKCEAAQLHACTSGSTCVKLLLAAATPVLSQTILAHTALFAVSCTNIHADMRPPLR